MSDSRSRKALLVTGTDTGVGKTMLTCAIARALVERGSRVGVYKPVETGCSVVAGGLLAEDVEKLLAAAGGGQAVETAITYRFALPAAPLVAAAEARETIDPLRIIAGYESVARDYDIVLVEGAGGLLVPIADNYTYLDVARQLALPVLCVVGSRLGCINHALLTLRMLLYSGVRCVGYAMNVLDADKATYDAAASNQRTIARFTAARYVGSFPFVAPNERGNWNRLGSLAAKHLELDAII